MEVTAQQKAAVAALADRYLTTLPGDADLAFSPAGLWLALGALAAGARGATADEFGALLGATGPDAAVAVTELGRSLSDAGAFGVATGVWSRVPTYRSYRDSLPDVAFGPFDPDEADAFVRHHTYGLIERCPVRATPETVLLLVNAVALRGRWTVPFWPSDTVPRPFTDVHGETAAVPTMVTRVGGSRAWRTGSVTVVELTCVPERPDAAETGADAVSAQIDDPGADGDQVGPAAAVGGIRAVTEAGPPPPRVPVRFALGEPGEPATAVLPALWASADDREPVEADEVHLWVPRFQLRTTVDLAGPLRRLGLTTAFTPAADFGAASPEPLLLEQAVQQTAIEADEKGIRAAAATAMAMLTGAFLGERRVLEVRLDRPFAVAALDPSGSIPVFAGWQSSLPTDPVSTPDRG